MRVFPREYASFTASWPGLASPPRTVASFLDLLVVLAHARKDLCILRRWMSCLVIGECSGFHLASLDLPGVGLETERVGDLV